MFALEENHSSRRRPLNVVVALLSALALAGVSALALRHGASPKPVVLVPQATTTVTCGQTITVSIVVGNDLTCATGNGLNVGHASIIINLNGHTFTGNVSSVGIENFGFSAVTVENGTVSGWFTGVETYGSTNKLTGLRASQNSSRGLALIGGSGSTALNNVSFKNGVGIRATGQNVKVVSNTVRENTGDGILVEAATGTVVQTNQAENNGSNGIENGAYLTTMTGNVTNANASDGVRSVSELAASIATTTANYNGAYGIEGAPGGKDGGGDTAKGNGQATQCKDVVCS